MLAVSLFAMPLAAQEVAPNTEEPVEVVDEPVPVHALLERRKESMFRVSPDGSVICYLYWYPSGFYFAAHDATTGEQLHDIPFGQYPDDLYWLNSRRILYSYNGQIFAMNIDGTDRRRLLSFYNSDRGSTWKKGFRAWAIMHLLPDDPEHILMQSWDAKGQPAIVRANLYTGDEEVIVFEPKLKMDRWHVDRDGDVRLGVRQRGDQFEFFGRNPATDEWELFDDYALDGKNTLGYTGRTYLSRRIAIEAFDYDSQHLYLASNHEVDRFRVVKYNLEQRQVVDEIYANERYDVGGPETDYTALLFDDAQRAVVGVRYSEATPKTVWFDERFAGYQQIMDDYRVGYDNRILDWSDDGKTMLVYSHSDTDPGRYSVFHPEEKRVITVAITNEKLKGYQLSATEVVRFTARDGYELEGYLNPAVGVDPREASFVVMPHGGPWARDEWGYNPWVQYFATRGFNVLRVNFRGSTGYGRSHALAGVRKIDTLMIDDIADATRWATVEGYARPGATFMFGHSYGGYAALMSSVRYPELYTANVAWAAPVDLLAQLKEYKKNDVEFAYEFWKTAIGDPRKEKDTLKRISPLYNVEKMTTPMLVFFGERDGLTPEKHVTRFEKALAKSGRPVTVQTIDSEGHTFRDNNNVEYVLDKSMRFFRSHTVSQ